MSAQTKRRAGQLLLIALGVIALDQLHKWYMLAVVGIAARPPIELTGFFKLVMVWNTGVSFGMMKHSADWMPYFLITLAVAIALVLLRLGLKSNLRWERVGYGMVIGGALANVIDRIRFGAVADFFYFHLGSFSWPAFNVADAFICTGVALLLGMMTFHPNKP